MSLIDSPDVPLRMRRDDLIGLPDHRIPQGFGLHSYRRGDESAWLEIHLDADPLNTFSPSTFRRQFGTDARLLGTRQIYLTTDTGRKIGTSTAWFKGALGRIHWVAIVPEFQGRGLAKPLLAETCRRILGLGHESAYLTTSSSRIAALSLYLSFGFRPDPRSDDETRTWEAVSKIIEARREQ